MIFLFLFACLLISTQYREHVKYGYEADINNVLFAYAVLIGVLSSVFTSLFLGTEYSDGTIRNKLVVGNTRTAIYLSNLIVSIAAAFLMCLAYLAAVCLIGIPLLGTSRSGLPLLLKILCGVFLASAAYSSICTLLSMLMQNKAIATAVSILGMVLLLTAASYLAAQLSQPEMYSGYTLDASGEIVQSEPVPNPRCLTGTKREVYEFLYDFLPSGQCVQYAAMEFTNIPRMYLCSLGILLAATAGGIWFFRRKDLK